MRNIILMTVSALLIFSCGQNDNKQKELELKERELAVKEKELALKQRDTISSKTPMADTSKKTTKQEIKKSSPNTKVMNMIFKAYEEGENMYLVFKDIETGKEYSFENPDEKKFNGIKIYVPDNNSQFEVKANPKYINKKFVVEAIYKTILTNGPDASTMKTKAWVINDLKLSE